MFSALSIDDPYSVGKVTQVVELWGLDNRSFVSEQATYDASSSRYAAKHSCPSHISDVKLNNKPRPDVMIHHWKTHYELVFQRGEVWMSKSFMESTEDSKWLCTHIWWPPRVSQLQLQVWLHPDILMWRDWPFSVIQVNQPVSPHKVVDSPSATRRVSHVGYSTGGWIRNIDVHAHF